VEMLPKHTAAVVRSLRSQTQPRDSR
jgi:hypothetical protein